MFLWLILSLVTADVAIVEFSGAITGTVEFEQADGTGTLSVVANLQDVSGLHGGSISWSIHNNFVNTSQGQSCAADKGELFLDVTDTANGQELVLNRQWNYAFTGINVLTLDAIIGKSLVLGSDIVCSGIVEIPEAVSAEIYVLWNFFVQSPQSDASRTVAESVFDTSDASQEIHYPVTVTMELTNQPAHDAVDALFVETSLEEAIVELFFRDVFFEYDLDSTYVPLGAVGESTSGNATVVITVYDTVQAENLWKRLYEPTFLPQLTGVYNFKAAAKIPPNLPFSTVFSIVEVAHQSAIAIVDVNVRNKTMTSIDIDELIPTYQSELTAATDGNATVQSWSSVLETQNPTANPTVAPSFSPTVGPTQNPTNAPSESPSIAPSTNPTCGAYNADYLGDPLIDLNNDKSLYADSTFQMTVAWPLKFSGQSLKLKGDDNAKYDWSSTASGLWQLNEATCLKEYTLPIEWSDVQSGNYGITWESDTNCFKGVLDLHITEQVNTSGSTTLGDSITRDIEYEMPFSIQLQTSVVGEATTAIEFTDGELSARSLNGLAVSIPDVGNPSVSVTFATEMPWPWVLNGDSGATVTGPHVVSLTSLTATASENCDPNMIGESCKQYWLVEFEVDNLCDRTGDYVVTLSAEYTEVPPYVDAVSVDVTMRLALLPSCEVTVASVEPTGTMSLYPDDTYTASSSLFYIDDQAWGRISLDALQEISVVTLDSLSIKQDGIIQNLQTTAFEYAEIATTSGAVATLDFSFRFTITELRGELLGLTTDVIAALTLTYADGTRRQLQVTTGEHDVPTDVKAQTTVVLLKSACEKPSARLHATRTLACPGSTDEEIFLCKPSGWSQLAFCTQTEVNSQQSVITESSTAASTTVSSWLIASVALALLLAVGVIVYYSKCSTKDTFTLTSMKEIKIAS